MKINDLQGKKIAMLGLGVNNQKLAEYFKGHGIAFQVFDGWKSPDELLGRIDGFDIVFRTPGLPYKSSAIQQAKAKGVEIYSQTKLFFDLCPCPIIGVTGTKGKGTTATLIARILEKAGKKVWLGGNIGQDPFEFINEIKPDDFAVLELSSFQLEGMEASPHIAVVLKITPEHMDYHKSFEEYVDAKKNITRFQTANDYAVLNYDNEVSRSFADITEATVYWNSIQQEVKPGCYITPSLSPPVLRCKIGGGEVGVDIMPISDIQLIGRFNLENITAAIAASAAAGIEDPAIIRKAVSEFKGLEHRLEFVKEIKGVKFYNDSFSTTPETAQAAISAFEEPSILIAGGSEKNADYTDLARTIANSKIKALVPIGITGPKIAELARKAGFDGRIVEVNLGSMETIVLEANKLAEVGDIILLSPACASFDMFTNYKHRGELFKKFVNKL